MMASRAFTALYLILLGVCVGGIVVCALTASTVFNADNVLRSSGLSDSVVTSYDSGILMMHIFTKFGYLLNASAVVILVYESLSFKCSRYGPLLWLIGAVNVLLIFAFTLYYLPIMYDLQRQGAGVTGGAEFESIHTRSRLVFKTLLVTLASSFIFRVMFVDLRSLNSSHASRAGRHS